MVAPGAGARWARIARDSGALRDTVSCAIGLVRAGTRIADAKIMSQRRKRSGTKSAKRTGAKSRTASAGGSTKSASKKKRANERSTSKKRSAPTKRPAETEQRSRIEPDARRPVLGRRETGAETPDVDRHALEAGDLERRTEEAGDDEDIPDDTRSMQAAFGERND
jgi:hypothetical protein